MTAVPPPPPPQPPAPPEPSPRGPGLRAYRTEALVLGFLLAFVLALVVPTWLFGGFEQQPKEKLPKLQVGTTVKYGEFKIKLIGARLLDESPQGDTYTEDGHAYFTVQATAENLTKEPAYDFDRLLLLGEPAFPKGTEPEDSMVVRDGGAVTTLMPGVPETIELIWEVPDKAAAKISDRVDMTLQRRVWQESFFEQRMKWMAPKPWYRVEMPVVQEDQ